MGLAFFDPDVPTSTKREMVKALQREQLHETDEAAPPKRITIMASNASDRSLESFVTPRTLGFFTKLQISTDFLQHDPEYWLSRDDYMSACTVIQQLQVTNDNAERGVALVQELNKLITHDEEQFQFLLQVVADHRRQYSCDKSALQHTSL